MKSQKVIAAVILFVVAFWIFMVMDFRSKRTEQQANEARQQALAQATYELVYSAPAETELEQEDLRSPANVWPEMIDNARSTIDVAAFYITLCETSCDNDPMEPTFAALRRAGERGVKIRFLTDETMAKVSQAGIQRLETIRGLELRVVDFAKQEGEGVLHAKFIVVDGRGAFLGSQNFDTKSFDQIREIGIRTTDPNVVRNLIAIFERDWSVQGQTDKKFRPWAPHGQKAYLVASPYKRNPFNVGDAEHELARLIQSAQPEQEILIEVMTYSPLTEYYEPEPNRYELYPIIDNALRAAAVRGVKIRLMVSDWNAGGLKMEFLKSLALVPGIEIRVVTIPQLKGKDCLPFGRVTHAKYMVIGNQLWLGTGNWKGEHFVFMRNVAVVVQDEELVRQAAALHGQLWYSSYAEPLDITRNYPEVCRSCNCP